MILYRICLRDYLIHIRDVNKQNITQFSVFAFYFYITEYILAHTAVYVRFLELRSIQGKCIRAKVGMFKILLSDTANTNCSTKNVIYDAFQRNVMIFVYFQ